MIMRVAIVSIALGATVLANAQKVERLAMFVEVADRAAVMGKKITVITDFWIGTSNISKYTFKESYSYVTWRGPNDLRDVKSITLLDANRESLPTMLVKRLAISPVPILVAPLPAGATESIPKTELPGWLPNFTAGDSGRSAFSPVIYGMNKELSKGHPLVFKWERAYEGRTHPAQRLDCKFTMSDDTRGDSRVEMMLETIDGQFIHVPLGDLRGSDKTVIHRLKVPLTPRSILRVHFWFANRTFLLNRPLPNGDLLATPDDCQFRFSIDGVGLGTRFQLIPPQTVRLNDWANKVIETRLGREPIMVDDFVNQFSFLVQTGASRLNHAARAWPSAKFTVTMRTAGSRDLVFVDPSSGAFVGGSTAHFTGGFEPGQLAVSNHLVTVPGRIRLSKIQSFTIQMVPGHSPPAGLVPLAEQWDIAGLAIAAQASRGPLDSFFDRSSLYSNMALNHRLNLNVDNPRPTGHSFYTIPVTRPRQESYSLHMD